MNKALRILILENGPADAELVTRELRKAGCEFLAKCVTTGSQAGGQPMLNLTKLFPGCRFGSDKERP